MQQHLDRMIVCSLADDEPLAASRCPFLHTQVQHIVASENNLTMR